MNKVISQYFNSLLNILYPRTCAACGNVLYNNEEILCLNCLLDLPRTGFHHIYDNEVARIFWGRIPVTSATSFIYFTRDSRYRQILHELKYRGQKKVGFHMGRMFGLELRETSFAHTDVILPVPLHPAKLRKRGYNQSELIANGISDILQIPVVCDLIVRMHPTSTQTKKSRYERWENVRDTFNVLHPEELNNKHILLVDDVITTGATIESCASALFEKTEGISLSVASLACVKLQ